MGIADVVWIRAVDVNHVHNGIHALENVIIGVVNVCYFAEKFSTAAIELIPNLGFMLPVLGFESREPRRLSDRKGKDETRTDCTNHM